MSGEPITASEQETRSRFPAFPGAAAVQDEPAQQDLAQQDAVPVEAPQPEAAQQDLEQLEPTQPDIAQPGSGQQGSGQLAEPQAPSQEPDDAAQDNTAQVAGVLETPAPEPDKSDAGDDTPAGPAAAAPTSAAAEAQSTSVAEPAVEPDPTPERVEQILAGVSTLTTQVGELTRLRARDADIIERLHADNTRLRTGELASATAPLLSGLVRLHDQMTSLAAGDQHSVAGMLRTQLVQLLEVAAGVTAFEPVAGEKFDASRHTGAGRVPTDDESKDNTVSRTMRPGFTRSDGTIIRVAEVEVLRHDRPAASATSTAHDQ